MKVLLDTNVLASAVATRGLCADVMREVLARHKLIVSTQILSELRRVLNAKFNAPREIIDDFIELLQQDSIWSEPDELPRVRLKDKDDLGILAAASVGGADVVVTGDKELQKLGRFRGVKIVSPRRFWDELTA